MPRFFRYHVAIALGSLTLKNTPPMAVTCSVWVSFALGDVSPDSRCGGAAPMSVRVVAAATQSTATAPANAPNNRLLVSIFRFMRLVGVFVLDTAKAEVDRCSPLHAGKLAVLETLSTGLSRTR